MMHLSVVGAYGRQRGAGDLIPDGGRARQTAGKGQIR
jgi:hypothetical protein